MTLYKLICFAICFALLIEFVKKWRSEFVIPLSLTGGAILFVYILGQTDNIFLQIRNLSEQMGVDILYVEILFKIIGISYICEFASAVCRDVGQTAFGVKIDLAGKIMILSSSLPIFKELMQIIFKILP